MRRIARCSYAVADKIQASTYTVRAYSNTDDLEHHTKQHTAIERGRQCICLHLDLAVRFSIELAAILAFSSLVDILVVTWLM